MEEIGRSYIGVIGWLFSDFLEVEEEEDKRNRRMAARTKGRQGYKWDR